MKSYAKQALVVLAVLAIVKMLPANTPGLSLVK